MSNSDEKSPGAKPVKRSRKRQASRPPTIDVEAVRLEAETAEGVAPGAKKKDTPGSAEKSKPEFPKKNRGEAGSKADDGTAQSKPEGLKPELKPQRIGLAALALSASIGAAASIILFAIVFGATVFTSDQKNLENKVIDLSGKIDTLSVTIDKSKNSQVSIDALKQQLQAFNLRLEEVQNQYLNVVPTRLTAVNSIAEAAKSSAEKSLRRLIDLEDAVKAAGEVTDGSGNISAAQSLRMATIETQVKRLSANIGDLGSKISKKAEVANLNKTASELQEEVKKLESRISTLTKSIANSNKATATSADMTTKLDRRLTKLEEVDSFGKIDRLTNLGFALGNLIRKIESGESYIQELKLVSDAIPDNINLKKIDSKARIGVGSVVQLQQDFRAVLRAVLAVEKTSDTTGVVGQIVGTAKSLIRIRRVGDIEGETREAIIARMEARVKAGDLPAALVVARKLKGASAEAVKIWSQSVEDRLTTIELIKNIRNDVISNLGSSNASAAAKE